MPDDLDLDLVARAFQSVGQEMDLQRVQAMTLARINDVRSTTMNPLATSQPPTAPPASQRHRTLAWSFGLAAAAVLGVGVTVASGHLFGDQPPQVADPAALTSTTNPTVGGDQTVVVSANHVAEQARKSLDAMDFIVKTTEDGYVEYFDPSTGDGHQIHPSGFESNQTYLIGADRTSVTVISGMALPQEKIWTANEVTEPMEVNEPADESLSSSWPDGVYPSQLGILLLVADQDSGLEVVGSESLDGREVVRLRGYGTNPKLAALTSTDTDTVDWLVDAETYLPVRQESRSGADTEAGTSTTDVQWLEKTPENLALLSFPADYRQVDEAEFYSLYLPYKEADEGPLE